MAQVRVRHQLNRGEIQRILTSQDGPVAKDLLRRGLRVESRAKQNLGGGASGPRRIDTGRLRSSIGTELDRVGGKPAVRVGTRVQYAAWVHQGTGVFGPRGSPIRPVRARRLVFTPRGSTRRVFARQVSGMRPNKFLVEALQAARG